MTHFYPLLWLLCNIVDYVSADNILYTRITAITIKTSTNTNAMHRNQDLEERLNFSKNTELSHNDRLLRFLLSNQNNSVLSPQNIKWPEALSETNR